ncbi:hypothetical protein V3C99_018474 [Haemonchus contortus]
MEIALQERSKGILYEGYTKSFRQCIFEEGDVVGKNERYEFRCDDELDCCGRTCCIPEATTIPLWLMIIFIILAAVLLLAVLGTLVWLLAKRRKPKPKKAEFVNDSSSQRMSKSYLTSHSQRHGTQGSGRDPDGRGLLAHEQETYSTPDHLYGYSRSYNHRGSRRGYPSRRDGYEPTMHNNDNGYDPVGGVGGGLNTDHGVNEGGITREIAISDARRDFARTHGDRSNELGDSRITVSSEGDGSMIRRGVHEIVEETFKQEITFERPPSTDSREIL